MAERLRLGMLAPIAWRVPPRHYGPWERVESMLTEGLVARGVDVTLFATADSVTRARLSSVAPQCYAEDSLLDAKVYECLHIASAFEQAAGGAFDILHNHFDFLPLTYARLAAAPLVTTIHGFSSERILPVYRVDNDVCHLVAISAADRHADLDYAATIHHGIDLKEFTPRTTRGDYLLFLVASTPTRVPTSSGTSLPSGGRTATCACTTACSAMRLTTPRPRRRRHAHHTPRAQLKCHPLWSHAWLDLACRSCM